MNSKLLNYKNNYLFIFTPTLFLVIKFELLQKLSINERETQNKSYAIGNMIINDQFLVHNNKLQNWLLWKWPLNIDI